MLLPTFTFCGCAKKDDSKIFLCMGDTIVGLTEQGLNQKIIKIPNKINGREIKKIQSGAFLENNNIKRLIIPDSVSYIGENILKDCNSIEFISTPIFTKTSDDNQFLAYLFGGTNYYNYSLIPRSLTSIEIRNLSHIDENCFYNCSSLQKIIFPTNLSIIGENAFYGCSSLKQVNIDSIQHWVSIKYENEKSNPLYYCESLFVNGVELSGDIAISSYTNNISSYCFYNYKKLHNIVISDEITKVGYYAFTSCTSINQVRLPAKLKEIGVEAFENCSNIVTITIPEETIQLCYDAFKGCTNLESVKFIDVNNWHLIDGSKHGTPINVSDDKINASKLALGNSVRWFKGMSNPLG